MSCDVLPPDTSTRKLKSLMTKDVVIVSYAFFLLFTSYQSMQNLQSSLNAGMGTAALSLIYACMLLSNLLVPTWLINRLGLKMTLVLAMSTYVAFIAVQFYPKPYTLLPAAFILGIGAAPLWTAMSTYLTRMGTIYADVAKEKKEACIAYFFSLFFVIFQCSHVVGNVISSTVLAVDSIPVEAQSPHLAFCGSSFCGAETGNHSLLQQISSTERYTMAGIYLAFAVLAPLVVLLFVKPMEIYSGLTKAVGSGIGRTTVQQLLATLQQMRTPYQLLLIPYSLWGGLQGAFVTSEYTAAFVSCGVGVHMVGYTMICYGVSSAVFCSLSAAAFRRVGRIPIFTFAAVVNAISLAIFLLWSPTPDQLAVFFVIPAICGLASATAKTHKQALYGVLFVEDTEAAFSATGFWSSSGFVIAFATSPFLCIASKIYVLMGCLALTVLGYLCVELMESRRHKTNG